jgi:hypothetical protein
MTMDPFRVSLRVFLDGRSIEAESLHCLRRDALPVGGSALVAMSTQDDLAGPSASPHRDQPVDITRLMGLCARVVLCGDMRVISCNDRTDERAGVR